MYYKKTLTDDLNHKEPYNETNSTQTYCNLTREEADTIERNGAKTETSSESFRIGGTPSGAYNVYTHYSISCQ